MRCSQPEIGLNGRGFPCIDAETSCNAADVIRSVAKDPSVVDEVSVDVADPAEASARERT
jgi:hypothetical protein